ncbi:MAG: leucine-rich repeat domain-containing protein, partial [Candidatus Bathyarchaeota archaeon]|nr:leucine-rich repeat domain-containing protein [Candidatus Termiticorpusculum sp.]
MDDKIIRVLLYIKTTYGDEIFSDKKRLNNILKDFLVGEISYDLCKGKINAFMYALDEHAYERLTQYKNNPKKTQKYYIDLLRNTYNDEVAIFVVKAISTIIGIHSNTLKNKVQTTNTINKPVTPVNVVNTGNNSPVIEKTGAVEINKVLTQDEAEQITGTHIIIPHGYIKIGYNAFFRRDIVSVVIPNSVTSIDESAFALCEKLKNITIPNSVTSIGKDAFFWCHELTSITIPNSVTNINSTAFRGCTSLLAINVSEKNQHYTSVNGILFDKNKKTIIRYPAGIKNNVYVIPHKVTNINEYTFSECEKLKNIKIPNSIYSIGKYAFYNCKELTNITLPNNLTTISESTFSECEKLKNIKIHNKITTIDKYAFHKCKELTNITLPNNLTTISESTFSECEKLKNIKIPSTLKTIDKYAFYKCKELTN